MSERVEPLDLGVKWEPNDPQATLVVDDQRGHVALGLRPHFDDPDQRSVVLKWHEVMHAQIGVPNDEALRFHPLYERGLKDVLWAGVVQESTFVQRLSQMWAPRALPSHYIITTKDSVAEVVATGVTVIRLDGNTKDTAAASLVASS